MHADMTAFSSRVKIQKGMTLVALTHVWEFPHFASEVRNVRLGLSSDGFNPFGNMSFQYSVWPVILVPYNLPLWMCMKKEYNMLSLLIPGPGYPGKCLDVYLRPSIEELKFLWDVGHPTYDKYMHEMFQMHVMVVGTIIDFPARGMLSGNVVRGYKAYPECLSDEGSSSHCNKICKLSHRTLLPYNHEWRVHTFTSDRDLSPFREFEAAPLLRQTGLIVWQLLPDHSDAARLGWAAERNLTVEVRTEKSQLLTRRGRGRGRGKPGEGKGEGEGDWAKPRRRWRLWSAVRARGGGGGGPVWRRRRRRTGLCRLTFEIRRLTFEIHWLNL
ncbi:hypothetical protein ACLB2K_023395 [Fragaria x ananassa]